MAAMEGTWAGEGTPASEPRPMALPALMTVPSSVATQPPVPSGVMAMPTTGDLAFAGVVRCRASPNRATLPFALHTPHPPPPGAGAEGTHHMAAERARG